MRILRFLPILFIYILLSASSVQAQNYDRDLILDARFGTKERQALIQAIYEIDQGIRQRIFGQEVAIDALQARLVQYIETFGSRTEEPVALHFVGLPGIGKSALVSELASLQSLGFKIAKFDAQQYTGFNAENFKSDLAAAVYRRGNTPMIVVVEELDKLPEIEVGTNKEVTHPLIGTLNEVLSSGKLSYGYSALDLSNIMVMTTMNLSPAEVSNFSAKSLGEQKNFYNFTIEDLQKFHEWILRDPSALPQVLSHLFRSNTVSRIAANTVFFRPLDEIGYKNIVRKTVQESIDRNASGANAGRRLTFTFDEAFLDFLQTKATYPPSGARSTISRTDTMIDQLIHFAKRATHPGDASLVRPRLIDMRYDPLTNKVFLKVTPQVYRKGAIHNLEPWDFPVQFSEETGVFLKPKDLAISAPPSDRKKPRVERPLSRAEIKAIRFPKIDEKIKGLATAISKTIIGQEKAIKAVVSEMANYLARPGKSQLTPSSIVLAGFPGIGKSELIKITGELTQLPVVRINLQQYSSQDEAAASKFAMALYDLTIRFAGSKYILLVEELDKVFEIDPQTRGLVTRPVMSLVKDLLNDGQVRAMNEQGRKFEVDVRDAFVAVTMNFAIDRFNFEADPRMTTLEDVMAAYKRLSSKLSDLKALMGTMFLPETVNRLLSQIKILKPLTKSDYEALILKEIEATTRTRLYKDGKNLGQIWTEATPAYKKYLFDETVIPSEGARNTVKAVRSLVASDLESSLTRLPKSAPLAGKPLKLILDYKPGSQTITTSIASTVNPNEMIKNIYKRPAVLSFPPLKAKGKMSETRISTSIHEFGHAFVAVRLGARFEYMTAVSPKAGVGGYVKWSGEPRTATQLISRIYQAIGARAMERIFHSEDPRNVRSRGDIGTGSGSDLETISKILFNTLYILGLDSKGGVFHRAAILGPGGDNFASVPQEQVEKMGFIVRDMEDLIVKDLLNAHPQDWYVDKISRFAKEGGMNETEFYTLIGYEYPGDNKYHTGERSRIYETFKNFIKEEPQQAKSARFAKQSSDQLSVQSRMKNFKTEFYNFVEQWLHETPNETPCEKVSAV